MADVKDEELLPFGWAPGGYTIRCSKCPDDIAFMGNGTAAKRSWRCREHAVEDLETIKARVRAITTPKLESAPAAGDQNSLVDGERLVTITIGVGRNGDIFEDTQCHGNGFADVYRGMTMVRDRINELIENRRTCPENPRKKP